MEAALLHPARSTSPATLHDDELPGAARAVILLLLGAGWDCNDIRAYFDQPQPGRDHAYEQDQIAVWGEVRITAGAMQAEIRRLLTPAS